MFELSELEEHNRNILKVGICMKELHQENQELKKDIKNIIRILNNNCYELTTTEEEFESLKRWNK